MAAAVPAAATTTDAGKSPYRLEPQAHGMWHNRPDIPMECRAFCAEWYRSKVIAQDYGICIFENIRILNLGNKLYRASVSALRRRPGLRICEDSLSDFTPFEHKTDVRAMPMSWRIK